MHTAVTLSHSLSLHPTPFFTHSRQQIRNRYCSVFVFHLSNSTYWFVASWTPPQLHHKTTLRIVPNQLLNMINLSRREWCQIKLKIRCAFFSRSNSAWDVNQYWIHFFTTSAHDIPCLAFPRTTPNKPIQLLLLINAPSCQPSKLNSPTISKQHCPLWYIKSH